MKNKLRLLVFCYLFILAEYAVGQGCSSAGVCSISGSGHNDMEDIATALLSASQTIELGQNEILHMNTSVGANVSLHSNLNFSILVPFRNSFYNQKSYSGLGDITAAFTRKLDNQWDVTVGVKVPIGDANRKDGDGNPLPMALQDGLGTYDFLFSISYTRDDWRFSSGYQYVFGKNKNEFVANSLYPDFDSSISFERGDDLMVRVDRTYKKSDHSWRASIIGINRIGGDKIFGGHKLKDSEGITVNVSVVYIKPLKNSNILELMAAVPVIARKNRSDGLTRTAILSAKLTGVFSKSRTKSKINIMN